LDEKIVNSFIEDLGVFLVCRNCIEMTLVPLLIVFFEGNHVNLASCFILFELESKDSSILVCDVPVGWLLIQLDFIKHFALAPSLELVLLGSGLGKELWVIELYQDESTAAVSIIGINFFNFLDQSEVHLIRRSLQIVF